jgi:hypothetical protein
MAQEVKYNRDHHAGATPEARITDRLRNSGGEEADTVVKTGDSARRTYHNIHHSANAGQHGGVNRGEPDIHGNKRGVV